jgi:predicted ATPase
MLETVREFMAERLAARPDATEVGRRHAGYYRALAEQAGRPAGQPHVRRVEAELVTQLRQRLGAGRFDQAFTAGSGLTQREAVAIVRDQRGARTQTSGAAIQITRKLPPACDHDGHDRCIFHYSAGRR